MSAVPKVGFVSLGCPKALVDSEQILTQLRAEGYDVASDYENADLVVVNTCGFIDPAVQESLDAIGEALNANGKVIVTGCLGARDHGELIKNAHPSVLAITGPHAKDEVMTHIHQYLPKPHDPYQDLVPTAGIKLTPRHYAYLKISEGCNHDCTFCIIPSLRGELDSRPVHDVLQEAEKLAEAGVKELLIISQDTSAYGLDIKYRTGFYQGRPVRTKLIDLARELGKLGIWIRMHYVYPYPHVDDLIPLMTDGLILPYLDIPFQHASPSILKMMRRPASAENVLKRLEKWRAICPDIAIRSSFIAGFPGETDADFETLLTFLNEAQLDRVGCFAYSNVDGAMSKSFPEQIPEDVKSERVSRLMAVQADISKQKLAQKMGKEITVLVDEVEAEGFAARSYADAPEIDGQVFVENSNNVQVGDFVKVRVIDSDEHDLWAERV